MEQITEKQKPLKERKKKKSKKTLLIVLGVILLVLGVAAFFGAMGYQEDSDLLLSFPQHT